MARRLFSSAVIAIAMTGLLATRASAQNPFMIDGNVPANGTATGRRPDA